jgi:hypothetical protein
MSRQEIKFGINPNDGTGDTLRDSMKKINDNFVELFGETADNTNIEFGVNTIRSTNPNGNLKLETNGTGTVQISHALLVNTGKQPGNSIFYSLDGASLLTIDATNKRIGINRSTPGSSLDVNGTATFSGNTSVLSNLTIGSNSSDRFTINSSIFGNLIPGSNFNLGTATNRWSQASIVSGNIENVTSNTVDANTVTAANGVITNITGRLTTSNDIRIQNGSFFNQVNSETLTTNRTVRIPNRNGILAIIDNNRLSGPIGNAPVDPIGVATDHPGDIAADSNFIYYCFGTYDGVAEIWKKTSLSTDGAFSVSLSALSVTQNNAQGGGSLTYNQNTGVFSYTPPDLSQYLTDISVVGSTLTYTKDNGDTVDVALDKYLTDISVVGSTLTYIDNDGDAFDVSLGSKLETVEFDYSSGALIFTKDDSSAIVVDLDGRYLTEIPATIQADLNGSVLADDSTLLVDASTGLITGKVINPYTNSSTVETSRFLITNSTAPTTSIGAEGDLKGEVVLDDDYLYHCIADFDGSTAIWKRVELSTW